MGCGYRLGARGELLASVRSVHVPPFESDTKEVGAGALFARALREELVARARVALAGAERADAIVVGRLKRYASAGLAFPTRAGALLRVGEFRATAVAEVQVRRRADGKVLLSTGDLTVSGEYLPGADVVGTEANRERALRQMAADLARRVAELFADAF